MDIPHQRRWWLGAGLILCGALLLIYRLHVVSVHWPTIFWGAVTLLGGYKLVTGFARQGRGVFLGTLAAAIGAYEVLRHVDAAYVPTYLVMPALLILLGVAFLLAFLAAPRRWHLLIPAVMLAGLGGLMILADEGYLDRWDLIDALRTWWPAALILFGAALLLNRHSQDHHLQS